MERVADAAGVFSSGSVSVSTLTSCPLPVRRTHSGHFLHRGAKSRQSSRYPLGRISASLRIAN